MIPLTILYDEYIDRPKLTEQKKPCWVYSSSLPTKVGVGTTISKKSIFLKTVNGCAAPKNSWGCDIRDITR